MWFRFKLLAAAFVTAALSLLAAYMRGRAAKGAEVERKKLKDYQDTRKRIDEADIPDDADAAREWLSERQRRGDM